MANKCLYVIRTLKAEGYSHVELYYLFNSLIITIINYGLSVYGCSQAELNTIRCFLTDVTGVIIQQRLTFMVCWKNKTKTSLKRLKPKSLVQVSAKKREHKIYFEDGL